jgi:hypothetical protein
VQEEQDARWRGDELTILVSYLGLKDGRPGFKFESRDPPEKLTGLRPLVAMGEKHLELVELL